MYSHPGGIGRKKTVAHNGEREKEILIARAKGYASRGGKLFLATSFKAYI